MKQPPHLAQAQGRMAPGVISLDGFLGKDSRDLIEILEDDDGAVRWLGLSHAEIAEALGRLTQQAVEGFGSPVREGDYDLRAEEYRGGLPCPFGHAGLYDKTLVEARRIDTGQTLTWTALHVHLIGEHGFYEGRGSVFRLDPAVLAEFLGLKSGTSPGSGLRSGTSPGSGLGTSPGQTSGQTSGHSMSLRSRGKIP